MSSFSEDRTEPRPHDDSGTGTPRLMALWPGGWTARALVGSGLLVGRSQECDVRIDEASVSRRHVFVHIEPRLEIEDLGGSNGTVVRGRRLAANERAPLSPGDTIEIGNAMLIVQAGAGPVSERAPPKANANAHKQVTGPMAAVASVTPPGIPALGRTMPPPPEESSIDRLVELVAGSNLSVIVLGETGVGKEVAAERIHRLSPRHAGPFVKINCAALTETLLESELFGHERGAFTGAVKAKVGLLESANGGTVLLDEVGEMPLSTQVKLLRVLESREVMRVGSVESKRIDVRVLAATNRDLPAHVAAGAFRSDLYFRLDGITIRLPPLRERRTEIVPIALTLLTQATKGRPAPPFTPAALAKLESYAWPGNIRELRNVVERALVLSMGGPIDAPHLLVETIRLSAPPPVTPSSTGDLRSDVDSYERARIEKALEQAGGNQTKAAELLGISRRTLVSRIEAYGMPRPRKK